MNYTVEDNNETILFTVEGQRYELTLAELEELEAWLAAAGRHVTAARRCRLLQEQQAAQRQEAQRYAARLTAWRAALCAGQGYNLNMPVSGEQPNELRRSGALAFSSAGFIGLELLDAKLQQQLRHASAVTDDAEALKAAVAKAYTTTRPLTAPPGYLTARLGSTLTPVRLFVIVPSPNGPVLFDAELWSWFAQWAPEAELALGMYQFAKAPHPMIFWRCAGQAEPVAGLLCLRPSIEELYPI